MTNSALFCKKVVDSGVKFSFIAEKIGMTRQGLSKKLKDNSDFKAYQMLIIADILHLSDEDRDAIFYAQNVD